MFWGLSLLIMLPLLELLTATFAKKFPISHKVILGSIILSSLALSILMPIAENIYVVDFGFIKLKFMCDIYSYFFGILVNVVWFLTILYSYSYTKLNIARNKISEFYKYLSLTIFAVFGSTYAADLWTLFIFYILLILFTAPLIIQRASKAAIKAERLYLITHLGTAIFLLLPAIGLLSYFDCNVEFVKSSNSTLQENHLLGSWILFLFVFGISKNCVLPFHNWITRATVAPTPVSALLHSVAAVKSGSIAMIKIVVYIFGLEYIHQLTANFWTGGWVFYLCGSTAVYAAYRAYKTTNVKSRFAYSTISQLSYIMSSTMIATPLAIMGSVLHIISHSLCKIVLFYIAGMFSVVYASHSTRDAARIAPYLKFWIFILALCGASIIGIPFMPGSYGKDYMILAEFQTHHYAVIIFLITGSFINIFYMYPIVKAGFFTKSPEPITLKPIPLSMKLAIIISVVLAAFMSFFISDLINFFKIYNV